jgi:peptide/nickel transport system permease protein
MSLLFLLVLACATVVSIVTWPVDPDRQDLAQRNLAPLSASALGGTYVLGTDQLGRDELARLVAAGRVSLTVGVLTVVLSGFVGVSLGLIAGYRGGWVDQVTMRLVDLQMSFPTLLLAIAILYVLGPSAVNLVLVLALTRWPLFARVARAQVLGLRNTLFVEAARSVGCSDARILFRHIAPSVTPALVTIAALGVAQNILSEAGLSFIGLGVQPPAASWGLMVSDGRLYMYSAPWLTLLPGAAILATALSVNIVSNTLQGIIDPRRFRR